MNDSPRLRSSVVLASLALAGCTHPSPTIGPGGMNLGGIAPPPVSFGPPPKLALKPPQPFDPAWLELDGFFPPGAKPILPDHPRAVKLHGERRMRFPTAEECLSPDGRFTLTHDGMKRSRSIFHWLMMTAKGDTLPSALFCTRLAFDVSWAEDSGHFAVTHYTGQNASEVFVFDSRERQRSPVAVRTALGPYFDATMLSSSMMLKAYRWTTEGHLVVRGVGRSEAEPYDFFGCELLVECAEPGAEPRLTYLRGYTLAQR